MYLVVCCHDNKDKTFIFANSSLIYSLKGEDGTHKLKFLWMIAGLRFWEAGLDTPWTNYISHQAWQTLCSFTSSWRYFQSNMTSVPLSLWLQSFWGMLWTTVIRRGLLQFVINPFLCFRPVISYRVCSLFSSLGHLLHLSLSFPVISPLLLSNKGTFVYLVLKKNIKTIAHKILYKNICRGSPENPQGAWRVEFPVIHIHKMH